MQVSPNSHRPAVIFQIMDFIPFISPLKNLSELFIKTVKPSLFSSASSYGSHLQNKTIRRCAFLTAGLSVVSALITYAAYKYYFEEPKKLSHDDLLNQAKKSNDPKVLLGLANMFYEGKNATQNFEEAFKLYDRVYLMSADNQAAIRLANLYYEGKGTKKNLCRAEEIFRQLSDSVGVPQNIAKEAKNKLNLLPFELLKENAEKGMPEAMYELGNHYFLKKDALLDVGQAKKWYGLAADKKHPLAAERLQAILNEENEEKEDGNTVGRGAYRLAKEGEGILPNENLLEYYLKAAKEGHKGAMYRFATICLSQANPGYKEMALAYLKQAAEGGYAPAMLAYAQHLDLTKKDSLLAALKYFEKGLQKGSFSIYPEVRKATDEAKDYLKEKAKSVKAKLESKSDHSKFLDTYWALGSIFGLLGENNEALIWFEKGMQLGSQACKKVYEELKK